MGPRMTRSLRPLLAASVVAAAAFPAFAQEYGDTPFTGGYAAPPTGTTTVLGTQKDDETVRVALPFEFPFFGRLFTEVSVCSNGWLAFGTTTVKTAGNAVLPTAAQPNGIVAAVWDDLSTGAAGKVVTFVEGTAPSRTFVVAWTSMDVVGTPAADGVSFAARLHEDTGVVEIVYDGANGTWTGLSYTSGIEDPTGTRAFGAGSTGNAQSGAPSQDWRFQPKLVPVTGRLLRDRPVAGTTGLGPATETGLPVAGADVVLLRTDTGETAARASTAADGAFVLTAVGADLPATFSARVLASSGEVRVLDDADLVYGHTFAQGVPADGAPDLGTTSLDASVDAVNGPIRRALNVHQAIRRAIVRAREAAEFAGSTVPVQDAETFPRIDARWTPGAASPDGRTQYVLATFTPATSTTSEVRTPPIVRVHEGTDNPDPWDDDVLIREAALHVFATISKLDTTLPGHTWDAVSSVDKAFVDGFSHWFACALQDRAQFIDTKSATEAVVRDLETLADTVAKKPDVTADVAASLWDLVDPAGEARDDFEGRRGPFPSTVDEVLRTIDRNLDAPAAAPGIGTFFDAWAASRTADEAQATSRIFIRYGTLADDLREPNDVAGEESSAAGPSGKLNALTLSPHNEDRFDVAFGGDGTQPLVVTVGLAGDAEIDVEVLAPGGGVVATASNAGNPSTARLDAATAAPAPAGTYTVRVVWRGGAAAGYTLSFHEPVRIVPATLGEWTAGVPFVQERDFEPAGGIPPYTFALSEIPEGLTATTNGRRLIGTPASEGTYDVTVEVSDASGPGVTVTQTVPLFVNPALRLARWFGAPSGEALDADLGTGGTRAEWTLLSAEPPAFDVAGGTTLRVDSRGAAVAPVDSFDLSVSAVDAAGAEVARSDSHVVVCDVLPAKGSAKVTKAAHFGFWFDAFAGAKPDLRFQIRGKGGRPRLVALVDDAGRETDLTGRVAASGDTVRLRGVRLPTTGRWFAIFSSGEGASFTGKVSVGGRSDVAREVHGVVEIEAGEFSEVPFEASAGSRASVLVRSEQVPKASRVHPSIEGLLPPGGGAPLEPRVTRRRGGEVEETGSVRLGETGTWTLRIGADSGGPRQAGPLSWRIRLTPPDQRSFEIFSGD